MRPLPTPPDPGRMDVPPLFGWGHILTVLTLVVAVALVFLVIAALGSAVSGRREWQAWLDARSGGYRHPEADTSDRSADPVRRGSGEDAAAVGEVGGFGGEQDPAGGAVTALA
jgi:hypothetical protein